MGLDYLQCFYLSILEKVKVFGNWKSVAIFWQIGFKKNDSSLRLFRQSGQSWDFSVKQRPTRMVESTHYIFRIKFTIFYLLLHEFHFCLHNTYL